MLQSGKAEKPSCVHIHTCTRQSYVSSDVWKKQEYAYNSLSLFYSTKSWNEFSMNSEKGVYNVTSIYCFNVLMIIKMLYGVLEREKKK